MQPVELFIQLGFAGLFLYLFFDIRKEAKEREVSFRAREQQFIDSVQKMEVRYQELLGNSIEREEHMSQALTAVGNLAQTSENIKQAAQALQNTGDILKAVMSQVAQGMKRE